jgi:hypothetical protein
MTAGLLPMPKMSPELPSLTTWISSWSLEVPSSMQAFVIASFFVFAEN